MAYLINSLRLASPKPATKYFFDANIWLRIVNPKLTPKASDIAYVDFFQSVAKYNQNTKIVVTSLLISEVINRFLRSSSLPRYARANGAPAQLDDSYYKSVYRQSAQFKIDYEMLCDDIYKPYHIAVEAVPDEFGSTFRLKDMLKSPPKGLDFNDLCAAKLCKEKGYVIVTDDSDFFIEDTPVLTLNKTLLDRVSIEIAKPNLASKTIHKPDAQ